MQMLVNIDVSDLERAIEFYQGAFDLHLNRKLFNGSVAEMRGASSMIYLLARPEGTAPWQGAPCVRNYQRHWTPVHLDFEVPDVEAAIEQALAAGARLESSPQSFGWGKIALLSCRSFDLI